MAMTDEPDRLAELLRRAGAGEADALGDAFEQYRPRLLRVVDMRMDQRLRGRLDPSDIVQEAFLDVAGRLDDYLNQPGLPFYLWVRFLAVQRLQAAYRRHLGTKKRKADCEVSLGPGGLGGFAGLAGLAGAETCAGWLAEQLVASCTSPSEAAIRAERRQHVAQAVEQLDPVDREVLALRHFEELSNNEVAQVLGVHPSVASRRYLRALEKLGDVLSASPAFADDRSDRGPSTPNH
jgi:RNA polymerase sigma-70 factor (ECF subfamily)